MELLLHRRWYTDDAILGELSIAGGRECYSLENRAVAIPAGRYRVILTPSERAAQGTLWSPRADHVLPLLVNVPGRSGIRMHAGNSSINFEGCIGVGRKRDDDAIEESRVELIALMAKLSAKEDSETWITIVDHTA